MLKIAFTAIGAVFSIYSIVSYFAYSTWYNITMDEVLIMYTSIDASDFMVLMARGCLITCVIFSTPLLHFPCRKAQIKTFFPEQNDKNFSWTIHLCLMLLNLILTHLVVCHVPQIRAFFSYGGAVTANSLVIIMPSLFYIKLTSRKSDGENMEFYDKKTRTFCFVFAIFGILFLCMNAFLLVKKDLYDTVESHE